MVFLSRLFLVPDVFSPDHVKGVIHGGSHLSGLVSPVDVALLSPYTVHVQGGEPKIALSLYNTQPKFQSMEHKWPPLMNH